MISFLHFFSWFSLPYRLSSPVWFLKSNRSFLISFPIFTLSFPFLKHSCHHVILLQKNCSGFLLHPISCCTQDLLYQYYLLTQRLLFSLSSPTLIMTIFFCVIALTWNVVSFFFLSLFFSIQVYLFSKTHLKSCLFFEASPTRPFLPIVFVSPIITELPYVHY